MTKQILAFAALAAFALSAATVRAADDKKPTEQQSRMATCNKDAGEKNLKGDERKKFMSECLKTKKASQQNKMTTCNKDAGEKKLKGDERTKFMSECLKG